MILGIDHAAAVRRSSSLAAYLGKLDDARRDAVALKLDDHAASLAGLIRSAQMAWQDNQAIIDMHERQESGREATRALRQHAHRSMEQLMLSPRPQTFGVL